MESAAKDLENVASRSGEEKEEDGKAAGGEHDMEISKPQLSDTWADRLRLWYEIARVAWSSRIKSTARNAAEWVIKIATLHVPVEPQGPLHEIGVMVALAHFIRAETAVEETKDGMVHSDAPLVGNFSIGALGIMTPEIDPIKKMKQKNESSRRQQLGSRAALENDSSKKGAKKKKKGSKKEARDSPKGEEAPLAPSRPQIEWKNAKQAPFDPSLEDTKVSVLNDLMAGLREGMRMKELWVVQNAAVYAWNYHMHIFASKDGAEAFKWLLPPLVGALRECHEALYEIRESFTENSQRVFCSITEALARVCEAQHEDAKTTIGICDRAISEGRTHMVKRIQAVRARVAKRANMKLEAQKGSKGAKGASASEAIQSETFVTLELLQLPVDEVPASEKQRMLKASVERLESVSDAQDESGHGEGELSAMDIAERAKRAFDRRCVSIELWARLGKEAYDLGEMEVAKACVQRAIGMLPTGDDDNEEEERGKIPKYVWCWFSVAECIMGLVLNAGISPSEQDM